MKKIEAIIRPSRLDEVKEGSERSFLFGTAMRVASDIRRSAAYRREVAHENPAEHLVSDHQPDELGQHDDRRFTDRRFSDRPPHSSFTSRYALFLVIPVSVASWSATSLRVMPRARRTRARASGSTAGSSRAG